VIDMPPGTGDTQISLSQNIPIDGTRFLFIYWGILCLLDQVKRIFFFKSQTISQMYFGFQ
jgi:hypothetical protein